MGPTGATFLCTLVKTGTLTLFLKFGPRVSLLRWSVETSAIFLGVFS